MRMFLRRCACMLLALLLSDTLNAQQDGNRVAEESLQTTAIPSAWQQSKPSEKYLWLLDLVRGLEEDGMVGEKAITNLKRAVANYPYKGIGVDLGASEKHGSTWEVRVMGVWKGSPAEKGGIRPGDWLMRLNGSGMCSVVLPDRGSSKFIERYDAIGDCIANTAQAIREASAAPVRIELERDNNAFEVMLRAEELGMKVVVFGVSHMPEWEAYLHSQAQAVAQLEGKIRDAEGNSEKLDVCFLTYTDLIRSVTKPFDVLAKFIESLKASE